MRSLAVRRAALVATRAASSSSSSSSSSRSGSSSRRALSSRSALSSASKSPLASLRQRPFPPSPLSLPLRQHVRCYASRKEEDKSWGEIAVDAAEVAKGALKKLGLGALTAVEKVLGGGGDKSPTSTRQRQQPQQRPRPGDEGDGGFWGPPQRRRGGEGGSPLAGFPSGGGLLGGLVGGVLGKAVQGALGAIAEQSREAGELADAALAAASADPRVRDEFGGALSRPAGGNGGFGSMSQSSSTVVVNGRARRSTTVSYPVAGPRGVGGFLEAMATSDGGGGGAADEVVVRVRSQRGKVIVVDGGGGGGSRGSGGGGGGSGDVIDVDFREV